MAFSTQDLVQGLRTQQTWAIEQLYRDFGHILHFRIRDLIHDESMAEDLVQEVFSRVWQHAGTFDANRGSLTSWLSAVAHNVTMDYLRSPESRLRSLESFPGAVLEPHGLFESEIIGIASAVESLRADQRILIELAFWEGLTQAEIARRFRCPLGTVKTWMRSALRELRTLLNTPAALPSKPLAQSTERVHARTAGLLLYHVIERSPDAIALADHHGRFILWNRASAQLFAAASGACSALTCSGLFLSDGVTPFPPAEVPLRRAILGELVRDTPVVLRNSTYPSGVNLLMTAKPRLETGERLRGGVMSCRRRTSRGPRHLRGETGVNRSARPGNGAITIRASGVAETFGLPDVLVPELPAAPPGKTRADALEAAATQFARWPDDPQVILQCLVEMAVELCHAGSAGVSLLGAEADGQELFHWTVLSGAFKNFVGGTTPRAWSPCGVCLDRGAATLFRYPARFFTYFQEARPEIVEGLVIPLGSGPEAPGTIWIVSHDDQTRFDSEDARIMTVLADLTAAALTRKPR